MFERFTGDARTTVVLAQVQARDLGHDYIGTEHLLLALLSTDSTSVRSTLGVLGVTADEVRADILAIVGRGDGAGPGHIPFTPRSKKVLELSLREALQLKHNTITPEHILLGLLREGEGLAAQILFKRGVDLGRLRQEVVDQLPVGTAARRGRRRGFRAATGAPTTMTPGAARASDRAVERAGGAPVASQHYLLGLLDDDSSLAARTLAALGVTREEVEAKVAELGTEGTTDEPPVQWGARNTSLEVENDLVTVRIGDAALATRIKDLYGRIHVDILRGPLLPGAERLWQAVQPAVEASVRQLEETTADPAGWDPLRWTKSGAATYSVLSKPGGPACQLWVNEGVDEQEVRTFVADWLTAHPPGKGDEPVAYLSVAVSRAGDVVPNAAQPDSLLVSHWSSGPGGPRADWPRVPLADLVATAVADLRQEPAA